MQIADRSHTYVATRDVPHTAPPPKPVTPRHTDSSGSTDDGTSATFAGTGNIAPYQVNTVA